MSSMYETPVQTIIECIKLIVCALVIAIIIRTFVIQPYYIPSSSMVDTLQVGDRIFVSKFNYGIHLPFITKEIFSTGEPKVGDIVVFPYPKDEKVDFVKRVVGVAGDVIEVRNKQLYRNGSPVQEDYILHKDNTITSQRRDNFSPVTVPEGKLFVMGDNRDNSDDSRFWGFVEKEKVVGKAFLVFWSSESLFEVRWERIGTLLK